jgi:hypothetical protein
MPITNCEPYGISRDEGISFIMGWIAVYISKWERRSLIAEHVLAREDFQAPQSNSGLSTGSLFNPWFERLAPLSAQMELWQVAGLESPRILGVTVR